MAYGGDEGTLEYDGNYYCLHDEDVWIWDSDAELWEAVEEWPDDFIVINGFLAVLNDDGKHYCVCPLKGVLMSSGCQCGGI